MKIFHTEKIIFLSAAFLLISGCASVDSASSSSVESDRPNGLARECFLPDGTTCPLTLPTTKGSPCTCTKFRGGLDSHIGEEMSGFAR